MVERVIATPAALELIEQLKAGHGPDLIFHQSGGCCDGSAPMCFTQGTYLTSVADVRLGELDIGPLEDVDPEGVVPVFISREQFAYWSHTHITIDVVPGRGAGFSLEGPTGLRFLIRSRIFPDDELPHLAEVGSG